MKLTGDRTKDKAALVAAAARIATELEALLVEQQALVAVGKSDADPAMARIARRLDELNAEKEEVRRLLDALRGGGQ